MAVTVTVSMRGGCICGQCKDGNERWNTGTHHNTRPGTATKVQLAVDIAYVVSHRSNRTVERYYVPVLVLQLKKAAVRKKRGMRIARVRALPECHSWSYYWASSSIGNRLAR